MQMICQEVIKVCPEFEGLLVPECEYRNGKCTEMFPCPKGKRLQDEEQKKYGC